MKLLNIDQLSPTTNKVIQIGGTQYKVSPISVGAFIKMTKDAEEYASGSAFDPMREIEMVVDLIAKCVPDASRLVIESLNLDQLKAIAEYIQGDDVDGAEDVKGNG